MSGDGVASVALSAAALAAWLALAPAAAAGQSLTGWRTVHVTDEYDFMVSLESITDIDNPGDTTELIGFHLGRMLVRGVEEERDTVIALRRARGRSVSGYGRYASSTDVYWVDCSRSLVSLRQTIDFDAAGDVLDRVTPAWQWVPPPGARHPEAVEAAVSWLCQEGIRGAPTRALLSMTIAAPF